MVARTALAVIVLVLAATGCSVDEAASDPPSAARASSTSTSAPVTRSGLPATGTVAFFDNDKGRGYITPDDGGPQLSVHFSEIRMEGFKKLHEGQRVSYVPAKGPGPTGWQATEVHPLDE